MEWPRSLFLRLLPTFVESWPQDMVRLAMPQHAFVISAPEAFDLAWVPASWLVERGQDTAGLSSLLSRLEAGIAMLRAPAFVRLGSGSPKDSALFQATSGRCLDAKTVIGMLLTSGRARRHVRSCIAHRHAPSIILRRWQPIEPWREYRLFLRQRNLVGISGAPLPEELSAGAAPWPLDRLEAALRTCGERLARTCHITDFVADVLCQGGEADPAPVLLDLNPWGPPTGAYLFDWHDPAGFNGSFRMLPDLRPRD